MVGFGSLLNILVIIFYTFWLSIPLYGTKRGHIRDVFIIYAIWVIIQIIIFKGRLGVPKGLGVPYN